PEGEGVPGAREAHEAALRDGLARGRLTIQLNGQKLRGLWTLVRTSKSPRDWLLIKKADANAQPGRDVLVDGTSVLSGLSIEALKAMPGDLVLDGEVVAPDENGRPSFDLLKQRLEQIRRDKFGKPHAHHLVYYVFDLLYRDGLDLRAVPLERRKRLLVDALF